MGADLAYIGSAFIATQEANAIEPYKQMIVESSAEDIVHTNLITGVLGNYLKPSIRNAGMDPENLPTSDPSKMRYGSGESGPKAWKEIWGCGQGVGILKKIDSAAVFVQRLVSQYEAALQGNAEKR